ncbi:MAG: PKD domain-containing protein, partial [Amnibacterium sp.]
DAATATDLADLFAVSPFPGGTTAASPQASFTADPATGPAPLAVTFTDTSTGPPTSWSWDFGDGATSTDQNPSHTFAAAGSYAVTLTAGNAAGTATASSTVVVGDPAGTAPTASFASAPSAGTAPLTVAFADTSTGAPTSWTWDFGDGTGSSEESPSHTYAAGGTFTVTLTAANATGATSATGTVTVRQAVRIGASTSARSSGSTRSVRLSEPAGLAAGDLLVAQIDADGLPTMSSVPSGWHALVGRLATKGSVLFAYSRTVGDPAKEPASVTFTLSAAKTWNAGISDFTHVNAAGPFDTAAATKTVTSSTSHLTVGAVTTVTPGALLIGGAGLNSTTVHIGAPTGWTEAWEADGGQDVDLVTRPMPVAAGSGTASFGLSAATTGAAWIRALRPAG